MTPHTQPPTQLRLFPEREGWVDTRDYDHVIAALSGGKDSLACALLLRDVMGDRFDRVELWHHDVDGGRPLMDWPVTPAYCRAIADHLGVPLYVSFKRGGFAAEMWRTDEPTAPIVFETPDGVRVAGGKGPPGTRGRFPQVSADLKVRWCSAYLKIDVAAMALRQQRRFVGKRVLFVTGERAEESRARSRYRLLEPHRTDLRMSPSRSRRRHVDHWRPVLRWTEQQVWQIIERHRIAPHPAYELGWGRVSCAACIFGSARQWASLRRVDPKQFERVANAERETGQTIQRKLNVVQLADSASPFEAITPERIARATSSSFDGPVVLDPWTLPAGAYGDAAGPT